MRVELADRGIVRIEASLDLPMPADAVWPHMRRFAHFVSLDPFHAQIICEDSQARAGSMLRIVHRFAIFRVRRIGRILSWHEGTGYSFSDLSRRGRRKGFPHIFLYKLESIDSANARLIVRVRGRWTAAWVPKWAIRFWIWWIMGRILNHIRDELYSWAIHRKQRAGNLADSGG